MCLFSFLSAVITRFLFILVSLIAVFRVVWVQDNNYYWLLTLLFLPLMIEMIITLRRQDGKDYKWFSPTIFLFLISIIPSIWILELHHQENKDADNQCNRTDYAKSLDRIIRPNTSLQNLPGDITKNVNEAFCPNNWILALHQILLILLIIGKWLLPLGDGVTRDQLAQLLLIFVGTAADILEFTSETLDDLNKDNSPIMVYIILAVWTWSMLQFPCHFGVVNSKSIDEKNYGIRKESLVSEYSTDLWDIVETLFIQDGPFLVVRITVMVYFGLFHQMLIFFTVKNFLVVILSLYRLAVICQDSKSSRRELVEVNNDPQVQVDITESDEDEDCGVRLS
ncbi:transmembrane protein 26 [Nothobranchius furzeri]|uniref:Transmembrane protein 26 n=2 Tax=Nothobranchius furzeri TaxID=105023 RepID=A0A1A8AT64_NOTFU|nr:transmembrane protein 26 [Nothobranchius furzeri]KAF7220173.1 transmembrane protein 26-like [Nothobranchius furzeri]